MVFHIGENRNYMLMFNHHLCNAGLPFNSKGLCSMMLSLLDNKKYTTRGMTRGMTKICKEGTDSIGSVLKEFEQVN